MSSWRQISCRKLISRMVFCGTSSRSWNLSRTERKRFKAFPICKYYFCSLFPSTYPYSFCWCFSAKLSSHSAGQFLLALMQRHGDNGKGRKEKTGKLNARLAPSLPLHGQLTPHKHLLLLPPHNIPGKIFFLRGACDRYIRDISEIDFGILA